MVGVLVNVLAVLAGGAVGLLLKKGIPKRVTGAVMYAVGLCVVWIGITGSLKGEHTLVVIGAMALGALCGTLLKLDAALNKLGGTLEQRLGGGDGKLAKGFVTASLLFCVGAMAVVGSLQAGLSGDNSVLYTKSMLDFISAMMLASTMGVGVLLSAGSILLYQGAIALLAGVLAPVLTQSAVADLTATGSLMIIALGLNMLDITKMKVADFLPGVLFAPLLTALAEWFAKHGVG